MRSLDLRRRTVAEPPRPRSAQKRRIAALILGAFAITVTLTGCPEKGPGEKAGEAIDDAGESLKDAVTPDGPAEDLGEKIDEATD